MIARMVIIIINHELIATCEMIYNCNIKLAEILVIIMMTVVVVVVVVVVVSSSSS